MEYICSYCQKTFNGHRRKQACNNYCSPDCEYLHRRRTERPTLEYLLQQLETKSYIELGKEFGVSDNAIRKWIRSYGVTPPGVMEGSVIVRCSYCKKQKKIDVYDTHRAKNYFCNKDCHDEYKRNKSKIGNISRDKIVEMVKEHGIRGTARIFGVCHKSLTERFKLSQPTI